MKPTPNIVQQMPHGPPLRGGLFTVLDLAVALMTGPPSSAILCKEKKTNLPSHRPKQPSLRNRNANTMGILSWIIVGLIAGFLAGQVMRGGGFGLIGDIVVGIVGALIGGFLAGVLLNNPNAVNGINLSSILVAFIGAVILLGILRLFSGRRRSLA